MPVQMIELEAVMMMDVSDDALELVAGYAGEVTFQQATQGTQCFSISVCG